jgi:hypothetical protein
VQPLFLTSQRLISAHWSAASRLLEPVLHAARGEFTLDDLETLCRDGHAVCGVLFDPHPVLAMVFEFKHYPRKTVINVIAIGGANLSAARTFWPQFMSWARESGASEIEACTAPAMTRMLRPLGLEHTYDLVRISCH